MEAAASAALPFVAWLFEHWSILVDVSFDDWRRRLAELVAATLAEFRGSDYDEMEMFAVDCHPWNGILVLAFLTRSEVLDAPSLSDIAEMAAWRYYDFGAALPTWRGGVSGIESAMRRSYESVAGNRADIATRFFLECADGGSIQAGSRCTFRIPLEPPIQGISSTPGYRRRVLSARTGRLKK